VRKREFQRVGYMIKRGSKRERERATERERE